jgi:hypothetical protein
MPPQSDGMEIFMKRNSTKRIKALLLSGIFIVTLFYGFASVDAVRTGEEEAAEAALPHATVKLQPSPEGNLSFVYENVGELSSSVVVGEDVVINATAKSGFLVDEVLVIRDKTKIITSFDFLTDDSDLMFMMPDEDVTVSVIYIDNIVYIPDIFTPIRKRSDGSGINTKDDNLEVIYSFADSSFFVPGWIKFRYFFFKG